MLMFCRPDLSLLLLPCSGKHTSNHIASGMKVKLIFLLSMAKSHCCLTGLKSKLLFAKLPVVQSAMPSGHCGARNCQSAQILL